MSLYVCRQCIARHHAVLHHSLRLPNQLVSVATTTTTTTTTPALSPSLLTRIFTRQLNLLASSRAAPPSSSSASKSSPATSSASPISLPSRAPPRSPKHRSKAPASNIKPSRSGSRKPRSEIKAVQQQINQWARQRDPDSIYNDFWRICTTESIEDQKAIWSRDKESQESIYRAFNSPSYPKDFCPSSQTTFSARKKPELSTSSPSSSPSPSSFTLQYLTQSHPSRLLQMHQYFETVLGIPAKYLSRIALLVAFASRGDMITTMNLFRPWREQGQAGKEMYSAVIRGLVGIHFQDSERRSFYVPQDPLTGIRNNGTTQIYGALELFYEFVQRGGTPSFETYHSLIVGLATFKNDMEGAELLLDHMLMMKKKPYVQVLHVMVREYVRRKDLEAAERIFWMLKEYQIQPKALTCNMMLQAVFQLSPLDCQRLWDLQHGDDIKGDDREEDLMFRVGRFKRQKIKEIRDYMQETGTRPDQFTFSTLFYGFGHLEDGLEELQETMVELSQSNLGPNSVILNALLFAHLRHHRMGIAESILDQMLQPPPPPSNSLRPAGFSTHHRSDQLPTPYQRKDTIVATSSEFPSDFAKDAKAAEWKMPGKGTFHAMMLAFVDVGDIQGMERTLDKMIRQREKQEFRLRKRNRSLTSLALLPAFWKVDLEADEITAHILLLGYLTARDFEKVELIQRQIEARADWNRGLHGQQDELIRFLKRQRSEEIVQTMLNRVGGLEDDKDLAASDSSSASTRKAIAGQRLKSPGGNVGSVGGGGGKKSLEVPDLLAGAAGVQEGGELEDDIEIDVTTLSTKLRGLMTTPPHDSK